MATSQFLLVLVVFINHSITKLPTSPSWQSYLMLWFMIIENYQKSFWTILVLIHNWPWLSYGLVVWMTFSRMRRKNEFVYTKYHWFHISNSWMRRKRGYRWHYKRTQIFSHKTLWPMTHVWGKLCGFIDYSVQYVVFIVAYLILKLQFDVKSSLLFGMQTHHNPWNHLLIIYLKFRIIFNLQNYLKFKFSIFN